jgi:hypothetical protein
MALQLHQQAVDLTPKGLPERVWQVHDLAVSFIYRYNRLGDLKDLEKALQHD